MPHESCHPDLAPRHRVVLLVDNGSNPFELACASEIFGARRRPEIGFELYSFQIASPERSTVMRDGLFNLSAVAGLDALETADTVIVPNRPEVAAPSRPAVLQAIEAAHRRGARLVGLCTGAYTLAEAGVLSGRRATVHWQLLDDFAHRFPGVHVEPDVLFVDDGNVLTSAGSAAALDLGLHIVRRDWGARIANQVGRRLVFGSFREGGQRQFIDQPVPATAERASPLSPALEWAQSQLDQAIGVQQLAARAHLSISSLHRRFRTELGTTPLAWLTAQRVQRARELLEQTSLPLDRVAEQSGLGTSANLRALIRRQTGVSPSTYRKQFTAAPA